MLPSLPPNILPATYLQPDPIIMHEISITLAYCATYLPEASREGLLAQFKQLAQAEFPEL